MFAHGLRLNLRTRYGDTDDTDDNDESYNGARAGGLGAGTEAAETEARPEFSNWRDGAYCAVGSGGGLACSSLDLRAVNSEFLKL